MNDQLTGTNDSWQTFTLYELAEYVNGRATKPSEVLERGVPVIKIAELRNGIGAKTNYVAEKSVDEKHWVREGDLVFAWSGSVGIHVYRGPDAALNQHIFRVVANDGIDQRFLRYLLTGQMATFEAFVENKKTTMGHVTIRDLKATEVFVPPIHVQRCTAHILGTLDDKIELNRRMNETLEEIARAIFKDWFVDFGPVRAKMEGREAYLPEEVWRLFPDRLVESELGDVPEGWRVGSLDEIAKVVYGAAFASKRFNDYGRGVPLIRIRDLSTNSPSVFTDEVHPKGHLIKPSDIVVGMDGEFKAYYWLGKSAWLNQRVCHFEPLAGVPKVFLRESIAAPLALLERSKVGTTVIHLGKRDIDNFEILVPSPSVLESFARATEQLLHRIKTNAVESRSLASKRDSLLPVLVSGEKRLS